MAQPDKPRANKSGQVDVLTTRNRDTQSLHALMNLCYRQWIYEHTGRVARPRKRGQFFTQEGFTERLRIKPPTSHLTGSSNTINSDRIVVCVSGPMRPRACMDGLGCAPFTDLKLFLLPKEMRSHTAPEPRPSPQRVFRLQLFKSFSHIRLELARADTNRVNADDLAVHKF